ncbi:platelet binding protein GspB-like isoform X3 [Equus przewalskii]|uniref:Platelet binding protein GspB-like isoform X3 n=1 Tax=Equus przewalskii TaxID=9798 RepID=A0ABM4P2V6_EQUPR
MLQALTLLLAFLAPATQVSSNLEGTQMSVTKQAGSSVVITCDFKQSITYVHWYRYVEGMAPQRLLYYHYHSAKFVMEPGISSQKYRTYEGTGKNRKIEIRNLEERDSGVYYCACDSSSWIKKFGKGTKLVVTPSDKRLPADISPKPIMFLPSIAEINLHKTGTYLCLLEKFFPDVINVYWKEKDGHTILQSQQGNTMKTNDTYMKLSWLTVTEKSMDKEHKCIVQHEKNKGGVDQEIAFPSVIKVLISIVTAVHPTKASPKDENKVSAIGSIEAYPTGQRVVTSTATTVGSTKAYTTKQSIVTTIASTTASPTAQSVVTSTATTVGSTKAYPTDTSKLTAISSTTASPTEQIVVTSTATTVGSTKAYPTDTSKLTAISSTTASPTEQIVVTSMATTVGSTMAYTTEESIVTTIASTTASPTAQGVVTSTATTVGSTTAYMTEQSIVTTIASTTASPTAQGVVTATDSATASSKEECAPLQLQLTSTSAYYTYLLLLLKSVVYLAIIASCLFRRTEVCGDGKSS